MEIMIGSDPCRVMSKELLWHSVTWRVRMSIPLYGFLEGDTIGLVVLAEEGQTVLELARKLQDGASVRVAHREKIDFVYQGKAIDPKLTVTEAGLQALDRFDVIWSRRL
jgi:Toluene-4-monooxygenase system protein B (TmoB)